MQSPSRQLPIKSAYNFRDLGGYIGAEGRPVKWRTLLRASDFNELADDDAAYLASIPVKTIIDFRAHEEFLHLPDKTISSVEHIYNLSIDAGNLVPSLKALVDDPTLLEDERFAFALDMMFDMYRKLATQYDEVFRQFFEILQRDDEQPVLFHCSAGKDRTGLASALILSALGVDRETIFTDYLMTNQTLQGKYDHFDYIGSISLLFKSVRRDFLETAFAEIEKKHGSLEQYLTNTLSVDLSLMRTKYLQ
ncbi:MAG: tyrosine-protein phosphatase [Paludibacteraceae bacterium]|nr:tyrosine-protein phosphatase [Paludibacteraceae bacterium]HOI26620.1 tyrosine-protein phosphatase [Paludibacteraceae bacterium]HPH63255.1 tyrosine-protein phosphatase [Paludibacteraceae bacterium]